jgi:hypothetical protein
MRVATKTVKAVVSPLDKLAVSGPLGRWDDAVEVA